MSSNPFWQLRDYFALLSNVPLPLQSYGCFPWIYKCLSLYTGSVFILFYTVNKWHIVLFQRPIWQFFSKMSFSDSSCSSAFKQKINSGHFSSRQIIGTLNVNQLCICFSIASILNVSSATFYQASTIEQIQLKQYTHHI